MRADRPTLPLLLPGRQTFADSYFRGQQIRDDLFAAFSVPRDGENCRGYVAYPIERVRDGYIVDGWFNYTHQQSWMQYPVMTAMENQMTNGWNWEGVFYEVSTAPTSTRMRGRPAPGITGRRDKGPG